MIKICLCTHLYLQTRATVITEIVGKHSITYWCTEKGMAGTTFLSNTFLSSIYKLEQFAIFNVHWNPKSPHLSLREGGTICSSRDQHQSFASLQHQVQRKTYDGN